MVESSSRTLNSKKVLVGHAEAGRRMNLGGYGSFATIRVAAAAAPLPLLLPLLIPFFVTRMERWFGVVLFQGSRILVVPTSGRRAWVVVVVRSSSSGSSTNVVGFRIGRDANHLVHFENGIVAGSDSHVGKSRSCGWAAFQLGGGTRRQGLDPKSCRVHRITFFLVIFVVLMFHSTENGLRFNGAFLFLLLSSCCRHDCSVVVTIIIIIVLMMMAMMIIYRRCRFFRSIRIGRIQARIGRGRRRCRKVGRRVNSRNGFLLLFVHQFLSQKAQAVLKDFLPFRFRHHFEDIRGRCVVVR
mmetsp:Transcript_12109/g.33530  ORF Transcript_12109/g.33530 Transcript_12109/m.33530 type:complete len:298 (+) Transcript_12109:188-1081(+)